MTTSASLINPNVSSFSGDLNLPNTLQLITMPQSCRDSSHHRDHYVHPLYCARQQYHASSSTPDTICSLGHWKFQTSSWYNIKTSAFCSRLLILRLIPSSQPRGLSSHVNISLDDNTRLCALRIRNSDKKTPQECHGCWGQEVVWRKLR